MTKNETYMSIIKAQKCFFKIPLPTLYQVTNFWTSPSSKHLQTTIQMVTIMVISVFDRVKNIVVKGENAGYQHFLLYTQCFP